MPAYTKAFSGQLSTRCAPECPDAPLAHGETADA